MKNENKDNSEEHRYELSKNDLDEIKYFSQGKEISSLAKKALTIISHLEGGLHHVPWKQKMKMDYQAGMCFTYTRFGEMCTYDSNELTTLVLLAHEMAMRIGIVSRGFKYMQIKFWERKREGDFCTRHPTIEQSVESLRKIIL